MKATPSAGDRPLVDAALRLTFQAGYEGVCHTLLDVLERTFDAHSIGILLRESRSRSLVTAACRGAGADVYAGVEIPSNAGIVGLAFSSGEPVFVPDVRVEDRWFDAARVHESGLPSILTVPLLHRDERVGVIGFHSPRFGQSHRLQWRISICCAGSRHWRRSP